MYHDIVSKDDKSSGFQNESAFQYKVLDIAFEEQVKALEGKNVEFTFDDGGVSFLTVAAPILEKYGRRGIFFISTQYIDTPGFLTSEQIKQLAARGHQVGSHSHSHPADMAHLNDDSVRDEWRTSVEILDNIIDEHILASIPNGRKSKAVVNWAQASGINCLYTSQPTCRVKTINGMTLRGRYVVHYGMTADDVTNIVDRSSVRRKLLVRWYVLSAAKTVLGPMYKAIKSKLLKH